VGVGATFVAGVVAGFFVGFGVGVAGFLAVGVGVA